jgi:hypothetical protein
MRRGAVVGVAVRPRIDDRVIRLRYEFIDQLRRWFATLQVRFYGSNRNFCEHERGAPDQRDQMHGVQSSSGRTRTAVPDRGRTVLVG